MYWRKIFTLINPLINSALLYFIFAVWGKIALCSSDVQQRIDCTNQYSNEDVYIHFNAWYECTWYRDQIDSHVTKCLVGHATITDDVKYIDYATMIRLINQDERLTHLEWKSRGEACNGLVETIDFDSLSQIVAPDEIHEVSLQKVLKSKGRRAKIVWRTADDYVKTYSLTYRNIRRKNSGGPVGERKSSRPTTMTMTKVSISQDSDDSDLHADRPDSIDADNAPQPGGAASSTEKSNVLQFSANAIVDFPIFSDKHFLNCDGESTENRNVFILLNAWKECKQGRGVVLTKCIVNEDNGNFEFIDDRTLYAILSDLEMEQIRHLRRDLATACNVFTEQYSFYDRILTTATAGRKAILESSFETEKQKREGGSIYRYDGQRLLKY